MQLRKVESVIRDAGPWLGLTAAIGVLDYLTPASYAFASIYVIPIFPAAWRSRSAGFVVAAVCSAAWIFCELAQRPLTDSMAQVFDYTTRILVFALAVLLAWMLQREQHRISELDRQRRSLLTLLEHEVPRPAPRARDRAAGSRRRSPSGSRSERSSWSSCPTTSPRSASSRRPGCTSRSGRRTSST